MDEMRRRRYLEAMGITAWVARGQPGTDAAAPGAGLEEPPVAREDAPATPATPATDEAIAEMDWQALEETVRGCRRCPLHEGRQQAVFGVGDRAADWMFIGEAPGAREDRLGEPFVGRAGQLLDAMLAATGHSRQQVYIANIIKSRPPDNRDPEPDEIAACLPYLRRQVALIRPRLLMLVGRIAAQTLLQTSAPIGRLRGRVHTVPELALPAVVTYHPAYLLRSPEQKARAWEDLRLAMANLRESGT